MAALKRTVWDTPDARSEAEFRGALTKMLRTDHWRVSVSVPGKLGRRAGRSYMTTNDPGFPDLVCLRPPDLVFLECKLLGASTSRERAEQQRVWINGIGEVEGNVRAWMVDEGAWPTLVRLSRGGIAAVEAETETGDNDDNA